MTRVRGRHHVLGIEHLLCELRHSNGTVLLATARSQWSKANQEKVESREGNWNNISLLGLKILFDLGPYPC